MIIGAIVLLVGIVLTGVGGSNMRKFTETTPEPEKTKFKAMTGGGVALLVFGLGSIIAGFVMRNK